MTEQGVVRSRYLRPDVTLETCEALLFHLEPDTPGTFESVIALRGSSTVRPVEKSTRLRDHRPGDYIIFQGRHRLIIGVEIDR